MRSVLEALVTMRGQKLEVCYNERCGESKVKASNSVAVDFLQDRCEHNQVVYGHSVKANFAEYYHLPKRGLKWIAMIRKPYAWIRSVYRQRFGEGNYQGTFDQFVQSGNAASLIPNLWRYFVTGNETLSLETRLLDRLGADNVLTLFTENYTGSVHRLATFLGASSSERAAMVNASKIKTTVWYVRTFNMTLSQSSTMQLREILRPAAMAYRVAEGIANR